MWFNFFWQNHIIKPDNMIKITSDFCDFDVSKTLTMKVPKEDKVNWIQPKTAVAVPLFLSILLIAPAVPKGIKKPLAVTIKNIPAIININFDVMNA